MSTPYQNLVDCHEDCEQLRELTADLLVQLKDMVGLARDSMQEANVDGAEYDIDAELEDAEAVIAKAKGRE